jgi:hypothetical protein
MFFSRCSLAWVLIVCASTIVLVPEGNPQTPARAKAHAGPPVSLACTDNQGSNLAKHTLSAEPPGHFAPQNLCNQLRLSTGLEPAPVLADLPAPASSPAEILDSAQLQLAALGKRGAEIEQARQAVLAILASNNACSAWYDAKEPDTAGVFRSLLYAVDEHGPARIRRRLLGHNDLYDLQPYVAWTRQGVGADSTITLNRHGAFFAKAARVLIENREGGPPNDAPAKLLLVGGFIGGTERARELTLLHELGHVIDLLPRDAGVPNGPQISVRNTLEVLNHCQSELEARSRLPLVQPGGTPARE